MLDPRLTLEHTLYLPPFYFARLMPVPSQKAGPGVESSSWKGEHWQGAQKFWPGGRAAKARGQAWESASLGHWAGHELGWVQEQSDHSVDMSLRAEWADPALRKGHKSSCSVSEQEHSLGPYCSWPGLAFYVFLFTISNMSLVTTFVTRTALSLGLMYASEEVELGFELEAGWDGRRYHCFSNSDVLSPITFL